MNSIPIEIANFFTAMQAGRTGAAALTAQFAPDATYSEPFTGSQRRHEGREAVMKAMSLGWEQPLPDMRIAIDAAETRGARIEVAWTCFSPALPGGKGQGRNAYLMRDGLIAELVTTFETRD